MEPSNEPASSSPLRATTTSTQLLRKFHRNHDQNHAFYTGSSALDSLIDPETTRPVDATKSPEIGPDYTPKTARNTANGLRRGTVVEISGPPGVGKTQTALNVAANALARDHKVTWLTSPTNVLPILRLEALYIHQDQLGRKASQQDNETSDQLNNLSHLPIASLADLYGLLTTALDSNDRQGPIPSLFDCSVLVIDGLSMLVQLALSPRTTKTRDKRRHYKTTEAIFDLLHRLARQFNVAILVLSGMTAGKDRPYRLMAGLRYGQWERRQLCTRVLMYRDYPSAVYKREEALADAEAEGSDDQFDYSNSHHGRNSEEPGDAGYVEPNDDPLSEHAAYEYSQSQALMESQELEPLPEVLDKVPDSKEESNELDAPLPLDGELEPSPVSDVSDDPEAPDHGDVPLKSTVNLTTPWFSSQGMELDLKISRGDRIMETVVVARAVGSLAEVIVEFGEEPEPGPKTPIGTIPDSQ